MAKDAIDMTLEELAQQMNFREGSLPHLAASAEILRRQTKAQLDACAATIEAANAEKLAAEAAVKGTQAAERNAKYMLASVIVATIAALVASAPAYVSYKGRNDLLKAGIVSTAMQQCTNTNSQIMRLSSEYKDVLRLIQNGNKVTADAFDKQLNSEMFASLSSTNFLLTAAQENQPPDIGEILDTYNQANEEVRQDDAKSKDERIPNMNKLIAATNNLRKAIVGHCADTAHRIVFD